MMYRIQECTRVFTGVSSFGGVAEAVRDGCGCDSDVDVDAGPNISAVNAVSGMTKME
jgi:hypothetical protein